MKKILVTGGLGYIGSHTVVELYNKGYQPIIIDDLSNSENSVFEALKKLTSPDLQLIDVDIKDKQKMKERLSQHEILGVIHFAAYKSVGESVKRPLKYYANNIQGLVNILDVCEEYNITNFIFSSSCTVYGDTDQVPINEAHPVVQAMSPYGNTKQVGEEIISDFANSLTEFKAISLRYFNPIGAHETGEIGELAYGVPNHLVPYLNQVANGQRDKLHVFGGDYNTTDGTCVRDYIHVVDLAKAHIAAIEYLMCKEKGANSHEVINIGTGKGTSVLEMIKAYVQATGVQIPYKIVEKRPGDVEQAYADATKSKKVLGWKAELSISKALADAWKWQKVYDNRENKG